MPLVIPTIFKAVDGVSAPMRAMGSSVASFASKAEAAIQRADHAMHKYTSVLSHAQHELLQTFAVAKLAGKVVEGIEFGFESVKEYDEAITKLQTNFRLSDKAMTPFKEGIMEVAKESYKSATEVSEVYNIIGSKNRELLNEPKALGEMAKSAITLSEGLKTDLIPTAESLTAVMAGFKLTDSAKAIDVIAGASSSGAVKGLALTEALKSISQEAHHANISLGSAAAMIEYIDHSAQDGGQSASALVRALLKLESSPISKGYRNAAGKFDLNSAISGVQKQLGRMKPQQQELYLKSIGFNSAKSVQVTRALLAPGALEELAKYKEKINETGIAEEMAEKNAGTFAVSLERVKASFGNALINNNEFSGGISDLNKALQFAYKHMDGLVYIATRAIEAFIAWKLIVFSTTALTTGLTVATGLLSVAQGIASGQVTTLARAMGFYELATMGATAETEALTVAMDANPVLLLVTAIGLLGIGLYAAYKHSENLNDSMEAIKKNDFNYYSTPEYKAAKAEAIKEDLKTNFGKGNGEKEKSEIPAYNPKVLQQQMISNSMTTTQKQNVAVTFENMPHGAHVTTDNDLVKIHTTSTHANGLH